MVIVGVFYLLIIIGCVLFYILYTDIFSLYLLLCALIVPVLLLGSLLTVRRKVSASLECGRTSCVHGDRVPVIISLTNRSILTASFCAIKLKLKSAVYGKPSYVTVTTPLYSRNTQQIRILLCAQQCGMTEVSIERIKLCDVMRLFSIKAKAKSHSEPLNICVFPAVFAAEPELSFSGKGEGDVFSKHRSGDDPSEIFQLREYQPGDKMNRIHWKASVKQNDYIVKDYSMPLPNDIAIIICPSSGSFYDRTQDPLSEYSEVVTTAASLSAALCDAEAQHSIIWQSENNRCTYPVCDTESYMSVFSLFLSCPTDPEMPYGALYSYCNHSDLSFSKLIVVTEKCTDDLVQMLASDHCSTKKIIVCKNTSLEQTIADDSIEIIQAIGSSNNSEVLSELII